MEMGMGMLSGGSTSNYPYYNVIVTYAHPGESDEVVVKYAFPQPSDFKNRFCAAGGGGYCLVGHCTGDLAYGAAGGATSAGYSAFETSYDDVVLLGNGSINWDATHECGYQALGEMIQLGKLLLRYLCGLSTTAKLYTYFESCSDGGRAVRSQVQRWGTEYDGVVAGAPAFRYAQQQVNHVFSSAVEHTLDYYPPPCALAKIVNATITACDPLDGRSDRVVARTDLCMMNFYLSPFVSEAYYCEGTESTCLGFGFSNGTAKHKRQVGGAPGSTLSYQPTQNGIVTGQDVAVVQDIYNGHQDTEGQSSCRSCLQLCSER